MAKDLLKKLKKLIGGGGCTAHTDGKKPLRSMKATAGVKKVFAELETKREAWEAKVKEAKRLEEETTQEQKSLHEQLWGNIGIEMGLWESPEGEHMHYNDETNEIEFYAHEDSE